MSVTVYLCLALVAVFGAVAPRLARRLPPVAAVWLLSAGAVAGAAAGCAALVLLSLPLVGQLPQIAQLGGWSSSVLALDDPVRTPIAVGAAILFTAGALRAARAGAVELSSRRRSRELAGELPAGDELAVIDDPGRRYAFALAGRPGRIVVSSGMLRAMQPAQRRALLAHERAHLRYRHDLHRAVVRICAAACPSLYALPAASRLACERWADEAAAARTDRAAVAAALTVAARSQTRAPLQPMVMAMAVEAVALRVLALRAPQPRLRPWLMLVPAALLVAVAACDANALLELHRIFQRAHAALAAR
ncbi:MAG TPA: M48 family metalloprotease [Jatrophihabitans sp.]|nr:M48 family metalloprotease [Jatrophihabitans sp.]